MSEKQEKPEMTLNDLHSEIMNKIRFHEKAITEGSTNLGEISNGWIIAQLVRRLGKTTDAVLINDENNVVEGLANVAALCIVVLKIKYIRTSMPENEQ